MLLDHPEGILHCCRTRIAMGVVEAINGNIKTLLRRRSRLQEPPLPAAQGPAHDSHPDGIRHHQESSRKCGSVQILAQNQL
jgi:hypothetical protein